MRYNKTCAFCGKDIGKNELMAFERGKWYHYGSCANSRDNILAIKGKEWDDKILEVLRHKWQ